MKVGDRVYCKKDCIMNGGRYRKTTTMGKYYTVIDVSLSVFYIYNDYGERHSFTIENDIYFDTEKELRKKKLNKLKNVDTK